MSGIIKKIRELESELSRYKILENDKHLRLMGNQRVFDQIDYWVERDVDSTVKLARIKSLVTNRSFD